MTDYEWKAGQIVFAPSTGWGLSPGSRVKIDRVTPSGRAVIGSQTYDKRGSMIGGGKWCVSRIEPLTPEHEQAMADWKQKRTLLAAVEKIKWRELTPDEVAKALPLIQSLVPA